jgi:hypothetical protein
MPAQANTSCASSRASATLPSDRWLAVRASAGDAAALQFQLDQATVSLDLLRQVFVDLARPEQLPKSSKKARHRD